MPKEHKMSKAEKEYNDYIKNCPDWYWVYGLHDAEILQVNELELMPDYKLQPPIRNCLEITLDSRGALFDTSIRKISLYNYKIISGNINDLKEKKIWWIGDTLSCAFNDYLLNIEFEKAKGSRFHFQIKFQNAVVERT